MGLTSNSYGPTLNLIFLKQVIAHRLIITCSPLLHVTPQKDEISTLRYQTLVENSIQRSPIPTTAFHYVSFPPTAAHTPLMLPRGHPLEDATYVLYYSTMVT